MKRGKPVVIWRVDLPFIQADDWKYEGSGAAQGKGGRTHTFGIKNPADIIGKAIIYQAPEVCLSRGKPCIIDVPERQD